MTLASMQNARSMMLANIEPVQAELVTLSSSLGRVLRQDVFATRDQPPFRSSSMDGWAVRRADAETAEVRLKVVGESAAGRGLERQLAAGEAVRVFTGAAMPEGADCVAIQEDATPIGDLVQLGPLAGKPDHLCPQGADFRSGALLLASGERLDAAKIALAAAAGALELRVGRKPEVVVVTTGNELAHCGKTLERWQIHDSAGPGLAAFCQSEGATVRLIPAVADDKPSLKAALADIRCDLLVTIGGASVGEHDLVKPAVRELGASIWIEGVNVRPGKPTWFGSFADGPAILGLPGNPVSALVCAELFLKPILWRLQGGVPQMSFVHARLGENLEPNGGREHFMRATLKATAGGELVAEAQPNQNSSLLSILAASEGLIRIAPGAPALLKGSIVEVLQLRTAAA